MSKKKSFSGSTMTLKDFHGGSIPTDLPLPSAPGVSVRPVPDRWGPSPAAGPHHHQHQQRQRPGSAGGSLGSSARSGSGSALTDDRGPPFLSTQSNIGRYFDEDERKPFDASASFPRRSAPVPDPVSSRPAPLVARSDPKPLGRSGAGPSQNAWGIRKEEVKPVVVADPVPVNLNSSPAILSSRIAQASAIDKISSGRWQSKLADVDVSRFQETVRVVDEARVSSPVQQEVRERVIYSEGARPVSNEGTYVGVDGGERPKLKLLPRTKLVEANETKEVDEKQGHQPVVDHVLMDNPRELQGSMTMPRPGSADKGHQPAIDPVRMDSHRQLLGSMNMPRPGSAGSDVGARLSDRPRLNLKPRSLPVEQSDETTERERKSVFGGARPRELVLKERGIDDIVSTTLEVTSPVNRANSDVLKTETKQKSEPTIVSPMRGERPESFLVEQRSRRDLEKKDMRHDHEKVDSQRSSWRNDNWKNVREVEKPAERRPEPETWRRPVEQPKPEVNSSAPRYGKAASALELAQAFSRSVSDPRPENSFPQRNLPSRPVVPFSRLTDTRDFYSGANTRHINGY